MLILNFFKTDTIRRQSLEEDNEKLFEALEIEDSLAIKIVYNRTYAYLRKHTQVQHTCNQGWGITFEDSDFEDMATDATMILLGNIRNGTYIYQGNDPVTYAIEASHFKVNEYRARKCNRARLNATEDDKMLPLLGLSFEKEQIQQLRVCIEKIGDPCKSLFKLRLEGFSWAEVFQKWQNREIDRGQQMQNVNTHGGLENNFSNNCMPSLKTLFFNTKF